MINKIPFNKPLYFKTLAVVIPVVIVFFILAVVSYQYELTTADPFGAVASSILLAYIIHLALWNPAK